MKMKIVNTTDFLIAQLSDLHIRPKGELYKGTVNSNAMLTDAIGHLHQLDRTPDLVLISGDLVDEGRPEEYSMLRELLADLSTPYLVIPGNHDEREQFRAAFADHHYLPAAGPLHYCVDQHPIRIVALDSTVPGKHYGLLDQAGLDWLDATLASVADKPTIVMLHHPPFLSGIEYMDGFRYLEPDKLKGVLEKHTNIELVVCGHLHRSMTRRWAGTVVTSCPSTATEIALQLSPAAKTRSIVGPRACLLHHWQRDEGLLTHISNIGRFEGPYPFA